MDTFAGSDFFGLRGNCKFGFDSRHGFLYYFLRAHHK